MYLRDNEILLGQNSCGDIVVAELKDDKIRGFNTYWFIDRERSYDGCYYVSMNGWCHDVEINGVTYKSGMKLAKDNVTPFFEDDNVKENIEDAYQDEGSYCSECGTFHATDQYHNVSYVILNECELFCKDCVSTDDMISQTEVESVDDIYNAKDIVGMDIADEFEEVHTIFHDCGWGGPATSHSEAEIIVNDLLEEHGTLFAGLTGIGQFQVYVTLYKRKKIAKTA